MNELEKRELKQFYKMSPLEADKKVADRKLAYLRAKYARDCRDLGKSVKEMLDGYSQENHML